MHTLQRMMTMAVLLVVLVPLGASALMSPQERHSTEEALEQAIEQAAGTYRAARVQPKGTDDRVKEALSAVQSLAREKRKVRLQIAEHKGALEKLQYVHGVNYRDSEQYSAVLSEERGSFHAFLRAWNARHLLLAGVQPNPFSSLLVPVLLSSLGDLTEENLRERILRQTRIDFLEQVLDAERRAGLHDTLRAEHESLIGEHSNALRALVRAKDNLRIGDGPSPAVKRMVAEVHSQVLRLQSELARIDARLRRRAERKLIEKGLLAPQAGEHSGGIVDYTPQFTWPAYGPISAGYMDPNYIRYFGIPHRGMDIVIGQGSPVASAADGVVFLSRDGGALGYSYVLVGHRGGYATLYGHLSHISVFAGQDVSAGQVLGLSGGQPGTSGAGPTTTGPHLHFEVIKGGQNMNPQSVLP